MTQSRIFVSVVAAYLGLRGYATIIVLSTMRLLMSRSPE